MIHHHLIRFLSDSLVKTAGHLPMRLRWSWNTKNLFSSSVLPHIHWPLQIKLTRHGIFIYFIHGLTGLICVMAFYRDKFTMDLAGVAQLNEKNLKTGTTKPSNFTELLSTRILPHPSGLIPKSVSAMYISIVWTWKKNWVIAKPKFFQKWKTSPTSRLPKRFC